MKALLLAAGFGTRLKPITDHVPKCMVSIQGKPLLARWLDLLFATRHPAACPWDPENGTTGSRGQAAGRRVDKVLINTHYLPEVVRDFVATSPWKNHINLVHETELLGTAGTILKNRDFFANEAFLVAHADNLTRFDVDAFINAHQSRKPGVEITMMTFETDVPQSCGIVELSQDNIVVGFHEKSPIFYGKRANAAVYIVEPSVIDFLATLNKGIIDLSTEVLPHYLGRMQVFHNDNYHRDIGTPQSLQMAEVEF